MATAQLTPGNDAILAEIFIAAPPARVFETIADPKQLAQWCGQKGVFGASDSKSDFRVGGKWSIEGFGPSGQPFHMESECLEVDPLRLLSANAQGRLCGRLRDRRALGAGAA